MTVLLVCCVNERKDTFLNIDSHFTSQSFQERKLLKGTRLELGTLLAPVQVFFHDSLLFVASNGLESNVYVFNSNDNYLLRGSIIQNGMGPDELLSVARMDFNHDGTFWSHDIITAHIKKFELIMDKDTVYAIVRNRISLNGPVINAFCLDTDLIGTTTQEIKPLSRFYIYDAQGNRIDEAGDYPTYNREIPATAKVEVYNGWISIHPSYNKFVLAYEFTDLIEFYDSDFKLLKRVQGPHNFLPEVELKQRGNSVAMVRRFDLTRFAYQRAVSSDSLIFLLYANGETVSKEDDQEEAAHFNSIVAIDWEGNPLYLFELDHAVISIAVDWKKGIIYGLNRIESEVYAFPF
jgi:hypothetical protein